MALPGTCFIPDRVVPAEDGEPADLWVYAVLPKEGWVPHSPGDLVRADHPGSAIKVPRSNLRTHVRGGGGRGGVRVSLSLAALGSAIHHPSPRSTTPWRCKGKRPPRTSTSAKTQRLRSVILWFFPIAGFAPDPLQRKWEEKTGLSMAWVSVGSALFGLALAFSLRGATLGDITLCCPRLLPGLGIVCASALD